MNHIARPTGRPARAGSPLHHRRPLATPNWPLANFEAAADKRGGLCSLQADATSDLNRPHALRTCSLLYDQVQPIPAESRLHGSPALKASSQLFSSINSTAEPANRQHMQWSSLKATGRAVFSRRHLALGEAARRRTIAC
ncbi:hypothetical protein [Streptomyces sp. NBC_01285]|uniref:hypothetical protein n=1 Tax=Streptomyces sp. NBC_01285 TaxID=2903813 RepID=UPI00224E54AC|nr:hypothetical protein [Streptomyces sp. NBC_01285]MCX4775258.1 hypothetical protein [Streptomyces sp. NBC_01285]